MFYDEKIETMSRAELNELQLERLKKAVKYAYGWAKDSEDEEES